MKKKENLAKRRGRKKKKEEQENSTDPDTYVTRTPFCAQKRKSQTSNTPNLFTNFQVFLTRDDERNRASHDKKKRFRSAR